MSRKRRNGDGSVYPRGSGYEAAITVAGKRRTKRAPTYRDAAEELRKLRAQRDTNTLPPAGRCTVRDWSGEWLHGKKALKYSTYRRYQELIRLHILPALGSIDVRDIQPRHLQRLYADLQQPPKSLSPRTVIHVHGVLHDLLGAAEGNSLRVGNPARHVRPPKVQDRVPPALSLPQARDLVAAVPNFWLGPMFCISALNGLRQSECLALRWSDVDLTAGRPTVQVDRVLERRERGRGFGDPKTAKSRETIPMSRAMAEILVTHRRNQAAQRLATQDWQEGDLVFPDERGAPLNPDRVRRHWKTARLQLGIPDTIPFMNLRHTHASLHLETGVPVDVVADAMRHTRPSTTMNIYRARTFEHTRRAIDLLDTLLAPPVAGGVAGGGVHNDGMDAGA